VLIFDARLLTIAFCGLLAVVGHRSYKTLLNPISALVAPLAAALATEAVFLPRSPVGVRAAAVLVGAVSAFRAGALVGARPSNPTGLHFELNRKMLSRNMLLSLAGVSALLVVLGAQVVRNIYDSAGVGFVGNGVFDRSLVVDAISGTTQELVVRAVTAFVFPAGTLVCLFWLSRQRFRGAVAGTYALGVVLLSLAVRARLAGVLALILVGCLLLLASGRRRVVRRAIPLLVLGPVLVFALFNQVAHDRYGSAGSGRDTNEDFLYATVGGPAGLAVAMTNEQPVTLLGSPTEHVRGQSIAGLLSIVGPARVLGGFTPVYVEQTAASQINVYTGAWALMWDVGKIGMLFVMGLLGLATNMSFRRLFTRPSAGALLATANLCFLLVCFPISFISTYNLWWGLWLLVPIVNRMFRVRLDKPTPRRAPELAVAQQA
jgi:hypothetical protein